MLVGWSVCWSWGLLKYGFQIIKGYLNPTYNLTMFLPVVTVVKVVTVVTEETYKNYYLTKQFFLQKEHYHFL